MLCTQVMNGVSRAVKDNLYLGIVVLFVVYFAIKYRDDTADKVGAPITGWM